MANNNLSTASQQELSELRSRVQWLDEERRKQSRKIAELEQRLELRERELGGREQRLQDMERKMNTLAAQQARQLQLDVELAQFRDDIVKMIEQYDQRRLQSEAELDRLRRVEHEGTIRELADIRKSLPHIPRLQQDMELRQAEEARLASLIGTLQGNFSSVQHAVETWEREFAFIEEKERQNKRQITELQTTLVETSKRIDPIYERIDLASSGLPRIKTELQRVTEQQEQLRDNIKGWLEQVQSGEYERKKQMEAWQRTMNEQQSTLEKFQRDWLPISDQYQEAKMALQSLSTWQQQQQQQQRESSELTRVEVHRIQNRWDSFRSENEKKWKTFEIEAEQRWASAARRERETQEQIHTLQEELEKLQREKELIKRIQTAQADALKKFPLIWVEEVEKAIAQDPHRRRQPALMTVREE